MPPIADGSDVELASADGRNRVRFEFGRSVPPSDDGWITYRIEWFQADPPCSCILEDGEEFSLFLNSEPIDELQSLVDGIRGVLRGDESLFRFEPIDEREFLFEVASEGGHYRVCCRPDAVDRSMRWFVGVGVTAAGLESFADRLDAIRSCRP